VAVAAKGNVQTFTGSGVGPKFNRNGRPKAAKSRPATETANQPWTAQRMLPVCPRE